MIDNYYGETTEEEIQTPDLLRQFAGESRLQYLLRRDGLTASLLVGKIVEKNPSFSDKQAYDEAWRTARTNRNSYIEIYEETIEIVPFEELSETRLENILRLDGQIASDIVNTVVKWGPHLSDSEAYDIANDCAIFKNA